MIFIDTNICIAYLKGDKRIQERLLQADEEESVCIPGMVEGELFYGVEKSLKRVVNLDKTIKLLELFPVVQADDAVMKKFGELKASLEKLGNRVDDADVIIAATAICNNATLATGNIKHFSRFDDLRLQNWFE